MKKFSVTCYSAPIRFVIEADYFAASGSTAVFHISNGDRDVPDEQVAYFTNVDSVVRVIDEDQVTTDDNVVNMILDTVVVFDDDDDSVMTIGEFFHACMIRLWEEEDGFSGKRPLGGSGWSYEMREVLVDKFNCSQGEADAMIGRALQAATLR